LKEYVVYKQWLNMVMLASETQQVIWLRTMKLALGGAKAKREAKLMVSEKIKSAQTETLKLMMGGSLDTESKNIRRKVRANKKRLSK
jgi:hypothetical protein